MRRRSSTREQDYANGSLWLIHREMQERGDVSQDEHDGSMSRSAAEIVCEYGPFPGVDHVHGVTYDGKHV